MTFYERYCALCAERGLKPHSRQTAELIGISSALAARWKEGFSPRTETLGKLSRFFGVSVDYLVNGGAAEELVNDDPELTEYLNQLAARPELRVLFHASKDASKEDIELAVKIIEDLRKRER